MDWIRRRGRGRPPHPDILTPAEWRVLEHARDGWSNAEIAERLGITVPTVKTHMSRILAKLELPDRGALATWQGEPAPEAPRRSSAAAPLGWLTSKLAGSIAAVALAGTLVAAVLVGMESGRATGDASPTSDGAMATSSAVAAVTQTPRPTAEIRTLESLYNVQPYLPPYGPTECCERFIPTRIPPPTLEDANAEGALFIGENRVTTGDPPEFAGVPGTSNLSCVDTAEANAEYQIRSGDFVVVWDTETPGATPTFLIPEPAQKLLVRALRLEDGPPTSHVHEFNEGPEQATDGLAWQFAPTLVLPEAGRWLLVATAGPQWGCFVVDAPEPPEAYRPARSIAEAEAHGASYPSEPPPDRISPSFARERGPDVRLDPPVGWAMRGGEKRVCVDIDDGHDVRSGEWVVRPASSLFGSDPYDPGVKVLIAPLHQPNTEEEVRDWRGVNGARTLLRMTATYIDDPQHTYVFEATSMDALTGSVESGTVEISHITGPVLPRGGGWFYVVTNGVESDGSTQWGCFASPGRGTPYPYPVASVTRHSTSTLP